MKLLFIDNTATEVDWIRRRLEVENNQVIVSTDSQTGWTMAHQAHYDVVLLTVHIPEGGQAETSYQWIAQAHDAPLLLIISPDTPANKAWGLEAGADDCVGHSIDIRELMARVTALYRRKAGQFPMRSVLKAGDLEIKLLEKSVYRAGKRIDLLPREYYLLVFLMQNQGRVLSKKEILESVWNASDAIRLNTVEVYINYLRNKIDRQSPVKLIHTVVGMGYVIRNPEKSSEE
ncbi:MULTISPECIES: response regulator transcription factor [Spirosoma]|uniref:Response regulator transcription factor n=1 Tax=Spirosoma liriopis TaxID=2937440 RepID=A0ABT0HHT1_9BACT|nr:MULTISPECIES: response regulator transcription factor [Spirosoma]MCK8491213.1 response regulator transcription factor [Spirosoma liriopis]UHG90590.1 response regulator transcription factor [Spirosoma oryzicola]